MLVSTATNNFRKMENFQLRKVYTISPVNLFGIREQRRGLLVPEEKKFLKNIATFYSNQLPLKHLYASQCLDSPIEWLNDNRVGYPLPSHKGKLVYEGKIPRDFDGIRSLKFTESGSNLIVGYGCGNIEVWPVANNDEKIHVKSNCDKFAISSIRQVPNTNRFLASSLLGTLFICDIRDNDYKTFIREPENEINSLDVCYTGKLAVTGGKDAIIRMYDIETSKEIRVFKRPTYRFANEDNHFHSLRVCCVKFHPECHSVIVSGGWDKLVKIWDTRTSGGCIFNFGGPYICGDAIDIKDSSVLTGSMQMNNSLKMWNMTTGKFIDCVSPLNRSVAVNGEFTYATKFHDSNVSSNTVIMGGRNPKLEVLDIAEKRVLCGFPVMKSVLAIDSKDRYIAYGGLEPLLRIVNYI